MGKGLDAVEHRMSLTGAASESANAAHLQGLPGSKSYTDGLSTPPPTAQQPAMCSNAWSKDAPIHPVGSAAGDHGDHPNNRHAKRFLFRIRGAQQHHIPPHTPRPQTRRQIHGMCNADSMLLGKLGRGESVQPLKRFVGGFEGLNWRGPTFAAARKTLQEKQCHLWPTAKVAVVAKMTKCIVQPWVCACHRPLILGRTEYWG